MICETAATPVFTTQETAGERCHHILRGNQVALLNDILSDQTRNVMTIKSMLLILTMSAAVVVSSCGQNAPKSAKRHIKMSTSAPTAAFSDGVLAGNTLYLAGKLGIDPQTQKVPDDPREEARLILESMKATLAEGAMTMDNLVSVQVFCTNPEQYYDGFNEVYRTYFTGPLPARAFLGSGPLLRGAHFEIQAVAVKD